MIFHKYSGFSHLSGVRCEFSGEKVKLFVGKIKKWAEFKVTFNRKTGEAVEEESAEGQSEEEVSEEQPAEGGSENQTEEESERRGISLKKLCQ